MHERCLLAWLGGHAHGAVCEVCGTPLRTTAAARRRTTPARYLCSAQPAPAQLRAALAFLAAFALHLVAADARLRAALGAVLVALAARLLRLHRGTGRVPAAGAAALAVLALPCVGWLARTGGHARALAAALALYRPLRWRDTGALALLGAAAAPRAAGVLLLAGHGAALAARVVRHGCSLRGAWRHSGPRWRVLTTLWCGALDAALLWHARGHTAKAAAFALVVVQLVLLTAAHLHVATDAAALLAFYAGTLYLLCVALGVLVVFAAPPAWRLLGPATAAPTPAAPLALPLPAALRALSPSPGQPCLVPLNGAAASAAALHGMLPAPGTATRFLTAAESCLPESYSNSSTSSSTKAGKPPLLYVVEEGVCPLEWKLRVAHARGAAAVALLLAAPGTPPPALLLPAGTAPALFAVPWSHDARCRRELVPGRRLTSATLDEVLRGLDARAVRLVPSQQVRWDVRADPRARALAGLGALTGRADYDCALARGRVQCSARASPCHLANFVRRPRDAALRECHFGVTIHYLGFTAFVYLAVLGGVLFLAACLVYNVAVTLRAALARTTASDDDGMLRPPDAPAPRFAPQAFFPDDLRLRFAAAVEEEQEDVQPEQQHQQDQQEAHTGESETEVWLALALLAAALALCAVALLAPRGPRALVAALVLAAGVCSLPCVPLAAGLRAQCRRWAARRTRIHVCNYSSGTGVVTAAVEE